MQRKFDLYNQLNCKFYQTRNNECDNIIYNDIESIIFNNNIIKLSLYFQTLNQYELNYIVKNKQILVSLFRQCKFEKGSQLYQSILGQYMKS